MDLVKAPLRISYVGGGTDYPEFYKQNQGAGVIAAAIDKFVYLYAHPLSEVAEENIRFTYRETESVLKIEDLKHPVMREMLRDVKWNFRTNFGTFADLPSGVGLGGSSSFVVALATYISHEMNLPHDPHALARLAVRIEREVLGEAGGIQDQYVAAFGGLRKYNFGGEAISVSNALLDPLSIAYLEERQMLFWLGGSRASSNFAEHTRSVIKTSNSLLKETAHLLEVTEIALSRSSNPLESFNAIREAVLNGWDLKKKFTNSLNPLVQEIEIHLRNFQPVSMKLCGAGGTGFVLVLAEPNVLREIQSELPGIKSFYPKIEEKGSQLLSISKQPNK
jgi:D-glycero-alpha-D-manno-heptose-7-phosphate kinase